MQPYKNFSFEVRLASSQRRKTLTVRQELRLADYNQGRRFGNASGQAGAFGSTNFGGFGQQQSTTGGFGQQSTNTGGGLFGSNAATSNPFSNNQSTGFGSSNNTGGGLFGQQKTGGLFGASTPAASGGLFGASNTTNTTGSTTAFGTSNTGNAFGANSSGGGGLFGSNNNQQQSKPFSFGPSNASSGTGFGSANTGGTGFGNTGSNANTGGGLFGSSTQTNNNPFGQQNNQTSNAFGGGGFGQQNQTSNQTTNSNPFGGFSQQNQEPKPGGLFGSTNNANTGTGGGLFGNQNNNTNQGGSGLFGQTNNNQSSGSSLFGQKPAATGGLFGQSNTNTTNTGGGLFGNQNQNNQAQGSGLFGNSNNNQQKPGGLFGNSTTGGSGLFGNSTNTNNQTTGGGLFGMNNQNQQQQPASSGLFGNSATNAGSSLFGNSQQQQQQQPTQQPTQQNQFQPSQTLTTSIMDPNAFGSPSIFSGLPPPPQVSGPIATPISQKSKQKVKAVLPYYRLSPNHAAAYQTPTRRGYGFSYSTYGSPNSVSSVGSTPSALGNTPLFGSINRTLGKSMSLSNLRGSYGNGESLLSPSTLSSGSSRYGTAGSMKKLTIDRSLRTDLFGDRSSSTSLGSVDRDRQPGSLKKKVSFDSSTIGGSNEQPRLALTNGPGDDDGTSPTPSAEEQGYLRSPRNAPKGKPSVAPHVDSDLVRGNELAVVPEDESPNPDDSLSKSKQAHRRTHQDQRMGEYWMKPSKDSLQKLSKEQRQQVPNFSVGREGCGKVEFNKPVDLSIYNLDEIFEGLVLIKTRSLTVYPDASRKPTLGKGMNVPSTIYLENSWPRGRDRRSPVFEMDGPKVNRHVDRLRKVGGTEFVDYLKDSGTWVFKVPHFTTYKLDYDDDDASEIDTLHLSNSIMSQPPDTPTPVARTAKSTPKGLQLKSSPIKTTPTSAPSGKQQTAPVDSVKKLRLPGSFEQPENVSAQEVEMTEVASIPPSPVSDRESGSSPSSSDDELAEFENIENHINNRTLAIRGEEEDQDIEMDMAGSFPEQDDKVPKQVGVPVGPIFSGDWATDLLRSVQMPKGDRKIRHQEPAGSQVDRNLDTEASKSSGTKTRHSMWTGIELLKSVYGTSPSDHSSSARKQSRGAGVVDKV